MTVIGTFYYHFLAFLCRHSFVVCQPNQTLRLIMFLKQSERKRYSFSVLSIYARLVKFLHSALIIEVLASMGDN